MKKQFLKLAAFCTVLTISTSLVAQQSPLSASIGTTSTPPVIDGVSDALWGYVKSYKIERTRPDHSISMRDGAAPTWQALWDADNTYILITVPDDHCYTSTESGAPSWLADKPEIYFDINANKIEDPTLGPATSGSGHYQFASDFTEAEGGDGTGNPPDNHVVAVTIDEDDALSLIHI